MAEHSPKAEFAKAGFAVDNVDPGLSNVLFDVWLASRAVHSVIDNAIASSGLDADEFAIYSVLAAGSTMTPSELADWMAAPPTTVSSYIKRFERRGHVRRVPNPEDGRSYRVELTKDGHRAHQAAGARYQPLLDDVTDQLGPDADDTRQRLLELRRIIDALSAD